MESTVSSSGSRGPSGGTAATAKGSKKPNPYFWQDLLLKHLPDDETKGLWPKYLRAIEKGLPKQPALTSVWTDVNGPPTKNALEAYLRKYDHHKTSVSAALAVAKGARDTRSSQRGNRHRDEGFTRMLTIAMPERKGGHRTAFLKLLRQGYTPVAAANALTADAGLTISEASVNRVIARRVGFRDAIEGSQLSPQPAQTSSHPDAGPVSELIEAMASHGDVSVEDRSTPNTSAHDRTRCECLTCLFATSPIVEPLTYETEEHPDWEPGAHLNWDLGDGPTQIEDDRSFCRICDNGTCPDCVAFDLMNFD